MPEKVVEKTFEALFALEDLREMLRRTAPFHRLTSGQKDELRETLARVRRALDEVEGELTT